MANEQKENKKNSSNYWKLGVEGLFYKKPPVYIKFKRKPLTPVNIALLTVSASIGISIAVIVFTIVIGIVNPGMIGTGLALFAGFLAGGIAFSIMNLLFSAIKYIANKVLPPVKTNLHEKDAPKTIELIQINRLHSKEMKQANTNANANDSKEIKKNNPNVSTTKPEKSQNSETSPHETNQTTNNPHTSN